MTRNRALDRWHRRNGPSGLSTGRAMGVDGLGGVTVASATHRNLRAGIRPHVAALAARDITTVHRQPATTVGRALVEIASMTSPLDRLDLVDLVALGDAAARHGWCRVEDIVDASIRATGRGCVLARRVARLVRSSVDPPMESRLRLLLVLAGLPEPVINFEIISGSGPIALQISRTRRHASRSSTTAAITAQTRANGGATRHATGSSVTRAGSSSTRGDQVRPRRRRRRGGQQHASDRIGAGTFHQ